MALTQMHAAPEEKGAVPGRRRTRFRRAIRRSRFMREVLDDQLAYYRRLRRSRSAGLVLCEIRRGARWIWVVTTKADELFLLADIAQVQTDGPPLQICSRPILAKHLKRWYADCLQTWATL